MTGERRNVALEGPIPDDRVKTAESRDAQGPQPGGRAAAPGALALVQAFLNTHYDLSAEHGGEVLTDPEALRSWLASRGLLSERAHLNGEHLRRAVAVREGLRALAFANNERPLDEAAMDAMRRAADNAGVAVQVGPQGPRFAPRRDAGLDGALGALLAIVAQAMLQDAWPRVKACPGRACGWVFFDHSRNQSARWCAMTVCGDREKARAYYRRRRDR
jgi:predicted RNA-binding Zn ribbon-like protein